MNASICRINGKAGALAPLAVLILGMVFCAHKVSAQSYTYFPSVSTVDGRFLSIAGSGINTLAQDVRVKIASPGTSTTLEIGIFDGETGGRWDQGTVPLEFTLLADSAGNGTGTVQVAQWLGSSMPDNNWFSAVVTNDSRARALNGDYFYLLSVRSTNYAVLSWSNFKIRTTGTISVIKDNPFAYTAAINSLADAQSVYPNYPTLSPTNYDGKWDFYLDSPLPIPFFSLFDGDMDHGSYDCTINDTDDPNTPNSGIPVWATGTAAVPEGIAGTGLNCQDANGNNIGGTTTSNPADDARNSVLRREPSVRYDVIAPNGITYANNNPSGNLEYEEFRLSIDPFDASMMDYHADSLPAGVYHLRIEGVDMSNLNAFRFNFDAIGVDIAGSPVPPLRPDHIDGTVSGTIYYDVNNNGSKDAGEPGVPSVTVFAAADYNNDGIVDENRTDTTTSDGTYEFTDLRAGSIKVTVDVNTLADDAVATGDGDGAGTPHTTTVTLAPGQEEKVANFGYERSDPPGTRTRGYWVNHEENWPVSSLTLGSVTYTKAEALGILRKPTKGDKTYSMAAQLIAAKLNLANGSEGSCILTTVNQADAWLGTYPIGSKASKWNGGEPVHNTLDDYNNGRMCAGHMD